MENIKQLQDSGQRRVFDTGAVRDIQAQKGRCDLLPLDVLAFDPIHGKDEVLEHILAFIHERDERALYVALEKFCNLREWTWHDMMLEVAIHMAAGAEKYGERNWEKGIELHSYVDSGIRHYLKWRRGDEDEPHDRAFCWNVICCISTFRNQPEMDDLPKVE